MISTIRWLSGCPYISFLFIQLCRSNLPPCLHDCIITSEPNGVFCTGKHFLSCKVVHAGDSIGGVFARLTKDSDFSFRFTRYFENSGYTVFNSSSWSSLFLLRQYGMLYCKDPCFQHFYTCHIESSWVVCFPCILKIWQFLQP